MTFMTASGETSHCVSQSRVRNITAGLLINERPLLVLRLGLKLKEMAELLTATLRLLFSGDYCTAMMT